MDFLGILFFDRFPDTSRDDLGNAALAYCRVLVSRDGVNFARFYWSGSNRIAIIIATDTPEQCATAMRGWETSSSAATRFRLDDLAQLVYQEQLTDPRYSTATYRGAGR